MKKYLFLFATLVMVLGSCSKEHKFKVSGQVKGASDSTQLVLEVSSNGNWFVVDSATTNSEGAFDFAQEAPEYPNIYRVRMGEQSIYFPIDSIDELTITTHAKAFDTQFDIQGSEHAKQVMKVDKDAMKLANAGAVQLKEWKTQLSRQILTDPSGIVAYYIINKYIGGKPLFDPMNDNDMKIIGAVANAFDAFKQDDPRTKYLVDMTLEGQRRRRERAGEGRPIVAEQINVIDIKLQDAMGKEHSLQSATTKGNVVLLNFTMYDQQFSPAYNKVLNDIYTQNKAKGFVIFQVGLDHNLSTWRAAAANLPWITVYDPNGELSKNVSAYNVSSIPASFIINRQGDIVERVDDPLKLKASIAKYM